MLALMQRITALASPFALCLDRQGWRECAPERMGAICARGKWQPVARHALSRTNVTFCMAPLVRSGHAVVILKRHEDHKACSSNFSVTR